MKKQKILSGTGMKRSCSLIAKFAMLSFFAVLLPMGCTAKNAKKMRVKKAARIEFADSTARKAVGDSVYAILMNGKIKSMLISNDSNCVKRSDMKYLSREDSHLLRFLVTDPGLYKGHIPVYGLFMPYISFEFKRTKNEVVYVNLDPGLREWTVTSESGKELYRSSLSTNDLLRFSHALYPENEFIKKHYYPRKK